MGAILNDHPAIVVAIITGLFSIILAKMQLDHKKELKAANEKSVLAKKEKDMRKRLNSSEKNRQQIYDNMAVFQITLMILILKNTMSDSPALSDISDTADSLIMSYKAASLEVKEIMDEHNMIMKISDQLHGVEETNKGGDIDLFKFKFK